MEPIFENLDPFLFSSEKIPAPNINWRRRNSGGDRFYCAVGENGKPIYFHSATTVSSAALPKSKHLSDWSIQWGSPERAADMLQQSADYGTFMHSIITRLIKDETTPFDLQSEARQFVSLLPIQWNVNRCEWLKSNETWGNRLADDLRSFHQFVFDYQVEFIFTEIILGSPTLGVAGAIDCVVDMNAKLYTDKTPPEKRKRIRAIIDFKSGRKGFWESHELQLAIYRHIWNENYPDFPIEYIFNFAPKDWRNEPTYELKNQTNTQFLEPDVKFGQAYLAYVYMAKKRLPLEPKAVRIYRPFKLGDDPKTTYFYSDGVEEFNEKESSELQIDLTNFYKNTSANYRACEPVKRYPDFISKTGSAYWYLHNGVVRSANHWGVVGTCNWLLNGQTIDDRWAYGFCEFSDFQFKQ